MTAETTVHEIPVTFTLKGENFERLFKNERFYIYKRSVEGTDYFEVFKRRIVDCINFETKQPTGEQKETYPKDHHFGIWAWCCKSLESAMTYVY